MTNSVTWMWIGNQQQINTTPNSPATTAEANSVVDYRVAGSAQIKPVDLHGDLRNITTAADGRTTAYSTTYNQHPNGPSGFTYQSPTSGTAADGQITGFLRVDYRLTFPDNTSMEEEGVLIQMSNGDMFFRPSRDDLADWADITSLYSVQILRANPLPTNTYVANISFAPTINELTIPCFVAGTMILTAIGERPVETLRAGDLVWTRDHGLQPLRWTGCRSFDAIDLRDKPKLRPIRIEAGALGENQPATTLLVSRQHRILIRSAIAQSMFGTDEVLAPACQLIGTAGVAIDDDVQQVTYCHLMLDDHQVLMANGALTESLYPGPQALLSLGTAALAEIDAIFPGLLVREDQPAGARELVRGPRLRMLVERHADMRQPLVA